MAGGAPVPIKFNPQGPLNFSPYGTIALAVNASGTSSSGVFTTSLSVGANSMMVQNGTTSTVFVAFGNSTNAPVVASVPSAVESNNSTPVLAGAIVLFTWLGVSIQNAANTGCYDTVAVLPGSAAGSVFFTAGEGV